MFNFLINPNKFNKFVDIIFKPLVIITLLVLIAGLFLVYFSPLDYQQGLTVKIMYIHVPSAWLALLTYAIMTIYSIIGLAFKIPFSFIINKAIAPIGAVFTILCLLSGSIWGKPMWGTWWVWDARLTSMVILLFFYIAYILTWKYVASFEKANKISSIIAIVGLFNLPVIKYSVDWWNTLHQPSSITLTSAPTIHYTMLIPLVIMFFGMLIYSLIIFLMKYKIEIIKFKIDKKKNYK